VKAAEVAAEEGAVPLKHLESLVSEAARIPVSLPDAKVPSLSLFSTQSIFWPALACTGQACAHALC
jgi:hypothetical protein